MTINQKLKIYFSIGSILVLFFVIGIISMIMTVKNNGYRTIFEIKKNQISYVENTNMTVVSFGSPEDNMLICIDAKGKRNIKKIIIYEEDAPKEFQNNTTSR